MSPCSFDVSFVPILPSNQNRSSGELAYRYFLPFSSEIICMMILQEILGGINIFLATFSQWV